jgi:hypothetical protein
MRSLRPVVVLVGALCLLTVMAASAWGGNPPGNNGTVKVDGVPFDATNGNEPHVGCFFQIDFYGFDQGPFNATSTFELVPPTAGGVLLTDTTFIGGGPAGGGNVLDASLTEDLSSSIAGLGVSPQPDQGFHVRLTVHADGSIGANTKHKTFWVQGCGGE